MTIPRRVHTATLLPDGRVLIAGGWDHDGITLATAETFDPHTGTLKAVPMTTERDGHGW